MSGSEPGEMAPESSKAVVFPKFDMHIYTSELTSSELKTAVNEDQDKNVISMDTFLKLSTWTRTVVSKGDPILEDQRPKPCVTLPLAVGVEIPELTPFQKNLEKPNSKIVVAREKKDQQNLAKAEAKRDGAGNAEGPRKKQKVQKHNEPTQSGSEEAFLATPLHQAAPKVTKRPVTIAEVAKDTPIPRRKFLTIVVTRT
ncbi:hypothetical protein Tco_0952943 [Tanacetum coccineum]|uniref:Uncharacterized protein n=1 Tax=Tanacetum coccineum TaxID=301880 RepID=A0ABQ5DYW9_9ASTR